MGSEQDENSLHLLQSRQGKYNGGMKRFNDWLAGLLGNTLSSMAFFYVCVLLDLIELPPVIAAHDVIVWCTYVSQTVIQLIALPVLGYQQKTAQEHHENHAKKLDAIMDHHGITPKE